MIASVAGVVTHVGLDRVVVLVGGVGMLVLTTPATAAGCLRGSEVSLASSLVVREDSLTLYGFAADAERDMFETVQSVSGVGPRLALAMLSVMGPEELRTALAGGDTKTLTKIPGIGAKSAQRLVLELRDKVGTTVIFSPTAEGTHASTQVDWREQVSEALIGLGWSAKQATDAVDKVESAAPADADIATRLRLALRELRR